MSQYTAHPTKAPMLDKDISYRRNLPHFHPEGHPLFITFHLADSLPKHIITELKEQRENALRLLPKESVEERYKVEKKYFSRYDDWLDCCEHGPRWLGDANIASIVTNKLHSMDKEYYKLFCYCLMLNHVHLLIQATDAKKASHKGQSAKYPVTDALRLLKGSTARECNLELKRSGSFWQHESYDHYVRHDEELTRIIKYIFNNPVKANLVREWNDWKFTYINPYLGSW